MHVFAACLQGYTVGGQLGIGLGAGRVHTGAGFKVDYVYALTGVF